MRLKLDNVVAVADVEVNKDEEEASVFSEKAARIALRRRSCAVSVGSKTGFAGGYSTRVFFRLTL